MVQLIRQYHLLVIAVFVIVMVMMGLSSARPAEAETDIAAAPDLMPEPEPEPVPVLVNKAQSLPADYVPLDLRAVDIPFSFEGDSSKRLMSSDAAEALEELFAQARAEGIELVGVSGYRSYERQAAIFAANVRRYGSEEMANRVSARPGESEHQTGLAMDISSPSVQNQLVEELGETAAGRWLATNAADFGFIIRYPEGKEGITGYQYEPWHLRFVGKTHALRIVGQNLTLEEYLAG